MSRRRLELLLNGCDLSFVKGSGGNGINLRDIQVHGRQIRLLDAGDIVGNNTVLLVELKLNVLTDKRETAARAEKYANFDH